MERTISRFRKTREFAFASRSYKLLMVFNVGGSSFVFFFFVLSFQPVSKFYYLDFKSVRGGGGSLEIVLEKVYNTQDLKYINQFTMKQRR